MITYVSLIFILMSALIGILWGPYYNSHYKNAGLGILYTIQTFAIGGLLLAAVLGLKYLCVDLLHLP